MADLSVERAKKELNSRRIFNEDEPAKKFTAKSI